MRHIRQKHAFGAISRFCRFFRLCQRLVGGRKLFGALFDSLFQFISGTLQGMLYFFVFGNVAVYASIALIITRFIINCNPAGFEDDIMTIFMAAGIFQAHNGAIFSDYLGEFNLYPSGFQGGHHVKRSLAQHFLRRVTQ
ncbi:Uncharacterised protein [Candidatus Venteria ishoeyi]|uniref:Uncharacterized protein n=1 Tax=Candidatus Venteria ishoeyi TaxID=1899563 RepID=A0A1H6F2U9_9GAMM|nr:Uncharacterised protein [Candidatus Venteria ishoeyi]